MCVYCMVRTPKLRSYVAAVPDKAQRVKVFIESLQQAQCNSPEKFAQSVVFAHRRWVASWPRQEHWCSHHLQVPLWPSIHDWHPFICHNNGQRRRTGTSQHVEHCTLFWHCRNACFPTQALDIKHVLTTVLADDNREVYITLRPCNQRISTPLFFCTTTT